MKRSQIGPPTLVIIVIAAVLVFTGCKTRLPGEPTEADRWQAPTEVSDFKQLYNQNCSGCHGNEGKLGAARSLNDSLYMAFVSDDALRLAISQGRSGTSMPAFSQQSGGNLTNKQIELLISGMRAEWSKGIESNSLQIPPYDASAAILSTVDYRQTDAAQRGAVAYQTYCAQCHGTNGEGQSAGSIVDPNFLNLVSDQGLRTTVVVGRSDLGKPDWRSNLPGHPMSTQEIDDVVAWIAAHRQTVSNPIREDVQSSLLNKK